MRINRTNKSIECALCADIVIPLLIFSKLLAVELLDHTQKMETIAQRHWSLQFLFSEDRL